MSTPAADRRLPWRKAASLSWLLLLGGLLGPLHAHSASSYSACLKAKFKMDDLEGAVRCAEPELKRNQAALDAAYKKVRIGFIKEYGADHPMVSSLHENQLAWERYRDTFCQLRIERGGLWAALAYDECTLKMYKERIETLTSWGF